MTTWVPIHVGSHPQVITLQALLEAAGIPTYIPDQNTKVMDPFITGAHPLQLELRVPAEALDDARALLDRSRDGDGDGELRLVDDEPEG